MQLPWQSNRNLQLRHVMYSMYFDVLIHILKCKIKKNHKLLTLPELAASIGNDDYW